MALVSPKREAQSTEDSAYGGGRYGWMALGLAFVGLVRQPRKAYPWLAVVAVGILFAYGTYWTSGGVEVKNANGILVGDADVLVE